MTQQKLDLQSQNKKHFTMNEKTQYNFVLSSESVNFLSVTDFLDFWDNE